MKKTLLFILLLAFSFHSFSQGAKYGVRGGYNISNLDFKEIPGINNEHRNSFYIGFLLDYGLSKTVSIMPEIQFSAEGANDEPLHLDYLQAPILLKFKLSEKLYIAAGPQVGIKIHKTDDGVKNFAYSGVGGIEYLINYGLFVDIRYTYGLSNIFDDNLNVEAKNSNIQIGLGFKF